MRSPITTTRVKAVHHLDNRADPGGRAGISAARL
jgi:hypothetical protein